MEWLIVSAKFGLVDETAAVPHYDATFTGLGRREGQRRANDLDLPRELRGRLAEFDAAIFVLPLVYLHAVGAPFELPGTQLYFASPAFARESEGLTIVPCGSDAARASGESPREISSARFAMFVEDVLKQGFRLALDRWQGIDKREV